MEKYIPPRERYHNLYEKMIIVNSFKQGQSTLLNGLIHYWPLDETGTGVDDLRADLIGGIDLTPQGTLATPLSGIRNVAYTRQGSGSWLGGPNSSFLAANATGQITALTFWYYHNSQVNNSVILGKWLATGNQRSWSFQARHSSNPNGGISLYTSNNGSSVYLSPHSTVPLVAGNWYFVYGVIDHFSSSNHTWYLSVNRETLLQTEAAVTTPMYSSSALFAIMSANGASFPNARVDEVMVHNRFLTDVELDYLYNSGIGRFYPFND